MAQMALVLALVLKLSESNFGGSSMQGFSRESLHSRYFRGGGRAKSEFRLRWKNPVEASMPGRRSAKPPYDRMTV